MDTTEFQAAILNLVANARNATPNGGDIRISTTRYIERFAFSGGDKLVAFLCVSVADNGQGIDKDAVSEIFTPFYTTKGERGTGLELPQVCAFT
jgi:signal transduction histidine kinase